MVYDEFNAIALPEVVNFSISGNEKFFESIFAHHGRTLCPKVICVKKSIGLEHLELDFCNFELPINHIIHNLMHDFRLLKKTAESILHAHQIMDFFEYTLRKIDSYKLLCSIDFFCDTDVGFPILFGVRMNVWCNDLLGPFLDFCPSASQWVNEMKCYGVS